VVLLFPSSCRKNKDERAEANNEIFSIILVFSFELVYYNYSFRIDLEGFLG